MAGTDKFDCIVVGAGPAGATVARQTALKGFKTLLVEKESLPRYKTCGGAVPAAIEQLLGFDFSRSVDKVATGATFVTRGDDPRTVHPEGLKVYLVARDAFDFLLVEEAVRAGARFAEETAVRSLEESMGSVRVTTDKGAVFSADVVVGADGARSVVAKAAGLQVPKCGLSMEGELYPVSPEILEKHGEQILFGFGFIGDGYGWVFPKKDHFSVGIGTHRSRVPGMASLYEEFKGSFDHLKGTLEKVRRGWFLPFNNGPRPLNTRRVCLAGDAASLVDPFSGEGIYYAVQSGFIAAETICSEIPNDGSLSDRYTDRINEEIVIDFSYARRLAMFFFRAPAFFYQRNRVVRAYVRLANRHTQYRNLFEEFVHSSFPSL